jgi:hypothetical protein
MQEKLWWLLKYRFFFGGFVCKVLVFWGELICSKPKATFDQDNEKKKKGTNI